MPLYNFSFGSNMSSNRLLARLPNAKRVGTAILKGYELTFDMLFSDGSGKCSIQKTNKADALVYGVVYEVNTDEKIGVIVYLVDTPVSHRVRLAADGHVEA